MAGRFGAYANGDVTWPLYQQNNGQYLNYVPDLQIKNSIRDFCVHSSESGIGSGLCPNFYLSDNPGLVYATYTTGSYDDTWDFTPITVSNWQINPAL